MQSHTRSQHIYKRATGADRSRLRLFSRSNTLQWGRSNDRAVPGKVKGVSGPTRSPSIREDRGGGEARSPSIGMEASRVAGDRAPPALRAPPHTGGKWTHF